MAADRDGARRLLVDGEAVTPTNLQVRGVIAVDDDRCSCMANHVDDATVSACVAVERRRARCDITDGTGVHSGDRRWPDDGRAQHIARRARRPHADRRRPEY